MTPDAHYQLSLQSGHFVEDTAQADAVELLQKLYEELVKPTDSGFRLAKYFSRKRNSTRGIYLWGGVGRGKTWLMDTFYHCLPFPEKKRMHFHHFMRWVHEELTTHQGKKNPLERIAKKCAGQCRIICFDEFFVTDITDAMLLGELLTQMFSCGITLVATSNVAPDNLYRDGLQRMRFLPAIEQLKKRTRVFNLDGHSDYRLRRLEKVSIFHAPLGEQAEQHLLQTFESLAPEVDLITESETVTVADRQIQSIRLCCDIGWFSFTALCDGPRSQNDYIELAFLFQTVIIENVPKLGGHNDDAARRFISLVDEFYDRKVKLVMTLACPPTDLYGSGNLSFEFKRTVSRLQEMQSREYLAQPHVGN